MQSFGEVSSVNSRIACSLQEQSGAVKDIAGRIYAINDDAEDLSKKSASVIQAVDEIDKNAERNRFHTLFFDESLSIFKIKYQLY